MIIINRGGLFLSLSHKTKGQIWAEAIAGPQALLLFAAVLLLASVYFFVLDGAIPQERQLVAPQQPITSDVYSALYTISGQQTYLAHIQTRYPFPEELRPLLQDMLTLVPQNAARISTWQTNQELLVVKPPFPGPQYAGYVYPQITKRRAIIIPTQDPTYNLLLEIYTLEYKAVGEA